MSLISAAVCVGVMSVMSTLETRAVWAMAGREKLRHGINFRFVSELRLHPTTSHNDILRYVNHESINVNHVDVEFTLNIDVESIIMCMRVIQLYATKIIRQAANVSSARRQSHDVIEFNV